MSIRDNCVGVFGNPLIGTGWAFREFPLKAKQVLKKVIAPFRRCCRPGYFQSARNRVGTLSRAEAVVPAETLRRQPDRFRFVTDVRRISRAVRLAEAMPARD